MRRTLSRLAGSTSGAVAPTVALSLVGLIAAGGIAFDYAQLATLDTELQQAADQAALAGATQLDGQTGAIERATAAAQSLLANQTLFANDGNESERAVTVPTVVFYASRDDAEAGTNSFTDSTRFKDAKFVGVGVATRAARYALTPIVGLLSSPNIGAAATAGLSSAICKVPPVMLCNPAEPAGNEDEDLAYVPTPGAGLKLITGNADTPGNFGWLQAGLDPGAPELGAALGYNSPPGDCQPITGVATEPGMTASVLAAFNTRFDVFANGNMTCPSQGGGICSPSPNTRKDLFCSSTNGTGCQNGNWNWDEAKAYKLPSDTVTSTTYETQRVCTGQGQTRTCTDVQVPVTTTSNQMVERPLKADGTEDPPFMGYPRDLCHSWPDGSQTCGVVGTGTWDRDAYFRVNYGWDAATWPTRTGLSSTTSRWQVYQWEMANPMVLPSGAPCASAADSGCRGIEVPQSVGGNNRSFSYPANGYGGVSAGSSQADRRRLTAAVLNCRAVGLAGRDSGIPVPTWLDVFLVEPALNRSRGSVKYTDAKNVYVEAIGITAAGGGGGVGQVVRRDTPYLIR